MQEYTRNRMIALGLDPEWDGYPPCEVCAEEGIYHRSNDCDHIDGRGGKQDHHNRLNDPYNCIFVCRERHVNKTSEDRIKRREIARRNIDGKKLDGGVQGSVKIKRSAKDF